MNFKFTENSVISIPLTYKGYRLEGEEKLRFRCLFKNAEGDFPYTLDVTEDNKGESGEDGKYTISFDMSRYAILPGRYAFDLSLVLESGSLVTVKTKDECRIEVISQVESLAKANGEVYFGADFIVEEGIIDGWNYRKWNSGIAESWGKATITLNAKDAYDWISGIGIYCASGYGSLPSGVFCSVDSIVAMPSTYEEVAISARVTAGLNIQGSLFGKGSVAALGMGDSFSFSCEARGRWK